MLTYISNVATIITVNSHKKRKTTVISQLFYEVVNSYKFKCRESYKNV